MIYNADFFFLPMCVYIISVDLFSCFFHENMVSVIWIKSSRDHFTGKEISTGNKDRKFDWFDFFVFLEKKISALSVLFYSQFVTCVITTSILKSADVITSSPGQVFFINIMLQHRPWGQNYWHFSFTGQN